MIPLILSCIAVYRLWDTPHTALLWMVIGISIIAAMTNQAVRNCVRMEYTGTGDRSVTTFWTKASMVTFVGNVVVAIIGLLKS
jgi:hypothetical protein